MKNSPKENPCVAIPFIKYNYLPAMVEWDYETQDSPIFSRETSCVLYFKDEVPKDIESKFGKSMFLKSPTVSGYLGFSNAFRIRYLKEKLKKDLGLTELKNPYSIIKELLDSKI